MCDLSSDSLLRIMFSELIHVVVWVRTSFLLMSE